ncbi:hypothetical protein RM780_07845 [Streptomyces sp. DSM 44917]|uniref:Phage tail tape measure protein domain-containing protein n=1 Tax=Streptomyces boetiae TaxID=3075541 RepID=A0ABU2L5N5_9ACTN|nr:hypothetical protein [Streptomyces sp. DSM 44917]MDT0306875.1 hypothetical protein [Streptomyces sp. DSM 44917]
MSSDTSLIFNIVAKDKASAALQRIRERVDAAAPAIGAGVAAGLAAGLVQELDVSAANDRLAAQLALGPAEAAELSRVSASLYTQAWGDSTATVNEAIRGVYQSIGETSEAEGGLEAVTRRALALSETFEYDLAEATEAAGILIRNDLAETGTEAFDLITAAAQELPATLASELPMLITEYGEFFSRLGVTGPQMMGLFAASAENPIFQLDKLGDAVKEFTLRIGDTDAVSEPLEDLGLNVSEIQEMVNTGRGTAAFDEVIEALSEVGNETERVMLLGALMGGPGEDAQAALMGLAEAGGLTAMELEGVAGATDRAAETLADNPARALEQFKRGALMQLAQISGGIAAWGLQNQGVMRPVLITLGALAGAILLVKAGTMAWTAYQTVAKVATMAWAGAQTLLNAAFWANPMTWIIAGIVALIAIIVVIATKTTWFQTAWEASWGAIKGAAMGVWRWITAHWPLLLSILGGPFGIAAGLIMDNWDSVVGFVRGLPGRITSAASGMWNGVTNGFRSAVNGIIRGWNNLSFTVGGGSFMGVGIPSFTLGTPNIPLLASGGAITRGGLAVVGERGAEVVSLPRGAAVHPSGTVPAGAGGGPPIHIALHLDGKTVAKLLVDPLRGEIRRISGGNVQAALGRGRS